jgi:hypothetical protein
MLRFILFISLLSLIFSCQRKTIENESTIVVDSIEVTSEKIINAIGITLSPQAKQFTSQWEEYKQFDSFILQYYAISKSDAMLNAESLSSLASALTEKVPENYLNEPATQARFNILDSECKRLEDMSHIPVITDTEVKEQVTKVLNAYAAVNAKINTVFSVKDLQDEINLDPDFVALLKQHPEEAKEVKDVKPKQKIQKPAERRTSTLLPTSRPKDRKVNSNKKEMPKLQDRLKERDKRKKELQKRKK